MHGWSPLNRPQGTQDAHHCHRVSFWHMQNERELTAGLERERRATEIVPIRLAPDDLEPDTLRAVIASFVLREGTDYGEHETSLADKVAQLLRQLRRGEAHITFDPATESVNVVVTSAIGGTGRPVASGLPRPQNGWCHWPYAIRDRLTPNKRRRDLLNCDTRRGPPRTLPRVDRIRVEGGPFTHMQSAVEPRQDPATQDRSLDTYRRTSRRTRISAAQNCVEIV